MSARDVMISTLKEHPNDPYGAAYWLEAALSAAGYTIVRKDEVREAALEEEAQLAASFDERTDVLKISGYGVASAIRSLKQKEANQ